MELSSLAAELALPKQMKNLVASIIILTVSLSLSAQGEAVYTLLNGFDQNKSYTKSSTKQQLLRDLKLNARHELRATGHGDQRYQHFYNDIPVKHSTVTFNTYGYGGALYLFDTYNGTNVHVLVVEDAAPHFVIATSSGSATAQLQDGSMDRIPVDQMDASPSDVILRQAFFEQICNGKT